MYLASIFACEANGTSSNLVHLTIFTIFNIFIPVIKLKDIVNEIFDIESGRSWLSPDGTFIPTNDDKGRIMSHPSKAAEIVPPNELNADVIPSEYLYKKGWQRISSGKLGQYYVGHVLFCSNPFSLPNQKQKNKLIQLAQEFGANKLIYDDETSKTYPNHIIWSKDDVL